MRNLFLFNISSQVFVYIIINSIKYYRIVLFLLYYIIEIFFDIYVPYNHSSFYFSNFFHKNTFFEKFGCSHTYYYSILHHIIFRVHIAATHTQIHFFSDRGCLTRFHFSPFNFYVLWFTPTQSQPSLSRPIYLGDICLMYTMHIMI